MNASNWIGRVGALAVALGVGLTVGIPPGAAHAAPTASSSDTTALLLCGGSCPTPDQYIVDNSMSHFITPTHPGDTITPVAVTTPSEAWPITGILRLIGVAFGDPHIFGPGGAAWPHEPIWKLSGLFDLLTDQSVQVGIADLEAAMAAHGNDHLVIFGDSAGAFLATQEKRKLAAQYPPGTTAPDINFVLVGDPSVPNGGLNSRFPGFPSVILGTFTNAEPTDTQFHTDVINRQYDGAADFPLYPLDVVADLNAVMGFFFRHTNPFDVTLPADPTTSPAYQGTHGDSSYYFFQTQQLPLFDPLRRLGVPEQVINVVQPFFRVLVELGYDRSIAPWVPTPARLLPTNVNPLKVVSDLGHAIGEGFHNALALVGLAPKAAVPAPVSSLSPAHVAAATTHQVTTTATVTPARKAIPAGTQTPKRAKALGKPAKTVPLLKNSGPGKGGQPSAGGGDAHGK